MKTLVIIGAGPGLGLSLAERFGERGFRVALVARSGAHLDALANELDGLGVACGGFVADVLDGERLGGVLDEIGRDVGAIDVMEFSPAPPASLAEPLDVARENVVPVFEQQVLGAIAAVRAVVPGMRERGEGALLFTTAASSINPVPMTANMAISMAGLRAYALTLHHALAGEGIFVGHVAIDMFMRKGGGDEDPDAVASAYYELYERRDRFEVKVGDFTERLIST